MDDCEAPEPETDSLVGTTDTPPIHIFGSLGTRCRIKQDTLKLRELHQLTAVWLAAFSICACSVSFMREPVIKYGINIRWISIISLFVTTNMYIVKFMNVKMGGWGAENSRFWCDVRIMYVRGYNTVRTIFGWVTCSTLFGLLAMLMSVDSSLLFIVTLMIIADWQAGIAENQNQYDIKFQDKFIDDNDYLCMEKLHSYQQRHINSNIVWSPFMIANGIKAYTLTAIIFHSNGIQQDFVFVVPVIVLITMWAFILPCFLDFVYYKQIITFCKLEIFRMLVDCTILPLIVMFTLV